MAVTDYDKKNLSQSQLNQLQKATEGWNRANAAGDEAGERQYAQIAAGIRNSAGYQTDSSGQNATPTKKNSSSSSGGKKSSSSGSSRATKVTYQGPNGESLTGYIIGGQTYKDPYGNTRIDNGSIVTDTSGRKWQMVDGKGVAYAGTTVGYGDGLTTEDSQYDPYEEAMKLMEQAKDAEQAALDAQIKQTINDLNAKIDPAKQETENANISAYNAYMQASNPFGANAQGMANLGLANSGFSESNLASIGNAYQGALNENQNTLSDYLHEIELAKEEAQMTGNFEKANALAAYSQIIGQQMIDNQNNILNRQLTRDQLAQDQANWEKTFAYQQEQDEYNRLSAIAQTLAAYGDFSGYRALGFTEEQIAAMKAAYQAQMLADQQTNSYRTGTRSGGSSGSSRSSSGSYEPAAVSSVEALAATPAVQNLRDTINEGVNILGLNSLQSLPLSSGNWGTTASNSSTAGYDFSPLGSDKAAKNGMLLYEYGGINISPDGKVTWANGWNANNWETKLAQALTDYSTQNPLWK